MILTCPNCTTRLQLDASKIPSRPFTVRCPKCQFIINAQPPAAPASEGGALASAAGGDLLPASTRAQRELRAPAPVYRSESSGEPGNGSGTSAPAPNEGELLRLLASLLQRGGEGETTKGATGGRKWGRRRALVCCASEHREALARTLARSQYEVYVADSTGQAIERMREDRMDVLILDTEFDPVEHGSAFITREINALRPQHRRRLFFVQLSASTRTADQHAAFLNHVNFIINPSDIEDLSPLLERAIREHNDLYRDFNKALNISDI
ncbi:MAG TPA: zinc-ribbon domain-containing protein [Pyrinomonadaceae bacterium]|jgi:predicted Zn finger-like uncharacterized protein